MRKNKIKKIAITTGAGDSFIPEVISNEVDLFITGDLKHHIALDSIESGIHLLDIDHYGSEKLVSDLFEKVIKEIDDTIIELDCELPTEIKIISSQEINS